MALSAPLRKDGVLIARDREEGPEAARGVKGGCAVAVAMGAARPPWTPRPSSGLGPARRTAARCAPWLADSKASESRLSYVLTNPTAYTEQNHGYAVLRSDASFADMSAELKRIARTRSDKIETGGLLFGDEFVRIKRHRIRKKAAVDEAAAEANS